MAGNGGIIGPTKDLNTPKTKVTDALINKVALVPGPTNPPLGPCKRIHRKRHPSLREPYYHTTQQKRKAR